MSDVTPINDPDVLNDAIAQQNERIAELERERDDYKERYKFQYSMRTKAEDERDAAVEQLKHADAFIRAWERLYEGPSGFISAVSMDVILKEERAEQKS